MADFTAGDRSRTCVRTDLFAGGDVFEGTFVNDDAHGSCTYTYADGTRMLCTYDYGKTFVISAFLFKNIRKITMYVV